MTTTLTAGLGVGPSWAEEPDSHSAVAAAQADRATSGGTPVVDEVIEIAKKQAAKSGKRVEIPDRHTETSTLYANPDGRTLRVEFSQRPVRVKRADGKGFVPIDTTLVDRGGVIQPKAIKGELRLSRGRDKTLLESKGVAGAAEVASSAVLPAPVLEGSTATYPNAYGKGIDLVVTATPTGFKQRLILRERPAGPLTFRIPVDLPEGITFGRATDGKLVINGKDGKQVRDISRAPLFDAVAANPNGDIEQARVGAAAVGLEGGDTLVYTPDAAFLADTTVNYPVALETASPDWWEPQVAQDTFINDNYSDPDQWYDSWNGFHLDRMLAGKSNNGSVRWRSYLRFANLDPGSPWWGAKIENADLRLSNYKSNTCGGSVGSGMTVRKVTSPWEEATMTWSTQPSVTTAGQYTEYGAYSPDCTSTPSMAREGDLWFTVEEIVQSWVDGAPNYGFQIAAGNESDNTNWRWFRSKEHTAPAPAHDPVLGVDFEMPVTIMTYFSEVGPRRSTPPTYQEALALDEGLPEGTIPMTPLLTDTDAAALMERAQPTRYEVGSEKLAPTADDAAWLEQENAEDRDHTVPTVTSTSPVNGAAGVAPSTAVTVTVSEPVWEPSLTVQDATGTHVPGVIITDADGVTLTFTPNAPLAQSTTYTATLSGAYDGGGNTLATHSWSFTTETPMAGHWKLDEGSGQTATDSSGNDHDATLGSTTRWVNGKSGQALSNVPDSQLLNSALTEARRSGTPIEVTERTTATSITYAMPDGGLKTDITSGPVRTFRDGAWVPIDTTLAGQSDVLRPKALADNLQVEVSGGGSLPFARLTGDGQSYSLTWPTALPKPVVKGATATYTDAAGKGADLVVTVLPTGFRHEIVLRERPAKPLKIRLGVQTAGLNLGATKEGDLTLKASSKGRKAHLFTAQPSLADNGDRRGPGKRATVTTMVRTAENGATELLLVPDPAFLAAPDTTFPVRLTAAATSNASTDVSVTSFDTEDFPTSSDSDNLQAGVMAGSQKARTYLRFDTTGLAGQTVTDAKLSLMNKESSACGAAVSDGIQVRRVTGTWDAENLYWANAPASTTEDAQIVKAAYGEDCAGGAARLEWPVTGIVQDWAAGQANQGLVLQSPTETRTVNWRWFFSTEGATNPNIPGSAGSEPKLTITTNAPVSTPSVSAPAISPAQTAGGTTTTSSLTPQLAATVADTIGGTLSAEFEIEHDPAATGQGTGAIWAGSSSAVASGSQATVAVPAGKLTDGWKIRWRARAVNTGAATASAWTAWQNATVDTPKPAVSGLQVTPSTPVNGVTVTTSLTPNLLLTLTDPQGQALRGEVEVQHDPAATGQGTGAIWAGGLDGVASGTQATVAVPAGKLTDGWKVQWRARAVNTGAATASAWTAWQNLTVDIPDPVSEPAVTALQVTPSQQVDGVTVTSSLTPGLLAQVSDPIGGTLRAEVEIEHDPAASGQGTGQIWAGGLDGVASGTQATVAVPAGKLTDGWKVQWRARAVSATAASAWTAWQQLTVTVPKPALTAPAITPSAVIDGVNVVTSLTPAITATVTDPQAQPLRAEVEIEHDPAASGQGTGAIWAGGVDNVASGSQATVAVPAGKLTDGWKIRWRARAVNTGAATASAWTDWQQATITLPQPGTEPLASTSGPVIRTDQSFTLAAWLKWSDKDGAYSVIEQKGTHQAPFHLGNTAADGLVFTFTDGDQAQATSAGARSGVEAPTGEWFHLAGVYNADAKTATLYLNGYPIKNETLTFAAWDAPTAMTLGSHLVGALDEVQVHQRALTPDMVQVIAASQPPIEVSPRTGPATATTTQQAPPHAETASEPDSFDYERVTVAECQKLREERFANEQGLEVYYRPYTFCASRNHFIQWFTKRRGGGDSDTVLEGLVFFTSTIVMHSYLGSKKLAGSTEPERIMPDGVPGSSSRRANDVAVWTNISDLTCSEPVLGGTENGCDELLTIEARHTPTYVGGDCSLIYATTDRQDQHGEPIARAAYYTGEVRDAGTAGKTEHYVFRSIPDDRAGNLDKKSTCTLRPWAELHVNSVIAPLKDYALPLWHRRSPTGNLSDNAPWLRCDISPYNESYYGGCYFGPISRIYRMDRGVLASQGVADHLYDAWQTPNAMHPQQTLDRPSVPVTSKAIPGFWRTPNGGPGAALHYIRKGTRTDDGKSDLRRRNAHVKDRVCANEFNASGDHCDEFPFGSTREGAAQAMLGSLDGQTTKTYNFSIRPVPISENVSAGNNLALFYARWRVLHDDPFWVSVK
ncbi:DNRLRE domain-containing protein [Nonomuraea sp. NPDC050310]|uniref:DNRLRE domain-containing protein n=1 Tax=Nonomuraea sp. NPDC050310 TaxID=3154935 RepID=UPI0033C236D3